MKLWCHKGHWRVCQLVSDVACFSIIPNMWEVWVESPVGSIDFKPFKLTGRQGDSKLHKYSTDVLCDTLHKHSPKIFCQCSLKNNIDFSGVSEIYIFFYFIFKIFARDCKHRAKCAFLWKSMPLFSCFVFYAAPLESVLQANVWKWVEYKCVNRNHMDQRGNKRENMYIFTCVCGLG